MVNFVQNLSYALFRRNTFITNGTGSTVTPEKKEQIIVTDN